MTSLTNLPVEVLIDNLLPSIPIPDLLNLASTNRLFAAVSADDTFWKRKLAEDFNFTGVGTARTSGWKFIYRGLRKPRVFVWGQKRDGRLGLSKFPKSTIPDVPFPTELRIPGVRVVSLVASGMAFQALDSEGRIFVWGTLDGHTGVLNSDGFSEPGKTAHTPVQLQLPVAMRSISSGRLHSTALDVNFHVWTFVNWGRPLRLTSALLSGDTPENTPAQIECGWGFSSVLTQSGDVLVWWPFSGVMFDRITSKYDEMNHDGDKKAKAENGVIPCIPWDLDIDPIRLPSLPPLPDLLHTGLSEPQDQDTRLIQIAAFDRHLVGLTNKGHVLKYGMLDGEDTVSRGHWEYLPKFSDLGKVKEHSVFNAPTPDGPLTVPQTMQITHVSAHFQQFTAYSTGSSSIVLMGDTDTTAESDASILPALQNRSVISVVLGDYHMAALTADGKLLTWGLYSAGALGLGDPAAIAPGQPGGFATEELRAHATSRGFGTPPRVDTPTEVRFDHGRKTPRTRFCFAAAASGWHTGALVIDLEPDASDEEDQIEEPAAQWDEGQHPLLPGRHPAAQIPIPHGAYPYFRVGFAGRGMGRGQAGRGGRGDSS